MKLVEANLYVANQHRKIRKLRPFGIVTVKNSVRKNADYIITIDNNIYHGGMTEAEAEEFLAGYCRACTETDGLYFENKEWQSSTRSPSTNSSNPA